jgi:hypothetical protein
MARIKLKGINMRPDSIRTKNARLNRGAAAVLNLMRDGQSLSVEFCDTGPRWRLSGESKVNDEVARRVIINPEVIGGGDSLFSNTTPQTWRIEWLRRNP